MKCLKNIFRKDVVDNMYTLSNVAPSESDIQNVCILIKYSEDLDIPEEDVRQCAINMIGYVCKGLEYLNPYRMSYLFNIEFLNVCNVIKGKYNPLYDLDV